MTNKCLKAQVTSAMPYWIVVRDGNAGKCRENDHHILAPWGVGCQHEHKAALANSSECGAVCGWRASCGCPSPRHRLLQGSCPCSWPTHTGWLHWQPILAFRAPWAESRHHCQWSPMDDRCPCVHISTEVEGWSLLHDRGREDQPEFWFPRRDHSRDNGAAMPGSAASLRYHSPLYC